MKKNGRFMVGLVGVATVVTYLVWTGVSEAMVYYLTPAEFVQKIETDPTFRDVGVRISGQVVPGSYARSEGGQLTHMFTIHDLEDPSVTIPVEYGNALPDTFADDSEVVIEGRLRADGTFVATTLTAKCASRYEAAPEELAG